MLSRLVGADDVGELAPLSRALPLLREVRALADVLLGTVEALLTVSQDGEVATDTLARADADVREWTVGARAAAVVGEVHAERRALWGWIV